MSSGFVSGGTADKPIERDDEWLRAQQEIEANRRRKEEETRQEGGKTLFEVLQSNKAAKQEAFEESIKLKNQFRNLDQDEVEFLDSVLESTRAKEAAVRKETTEQLDLFRRQQEEADKALLEGTGDEKAAEGGNPGSPTTGEAQWAVNPKKRKRVKDKEGLKGVKLRKSSSSIHNTSAPLVTGQGDIVPSPPSEIDTDPKSVNTTIKSKSDEKITTSPSPVHPKKPPPTLPITACGSKLPRGSPLGLGLSGYSSEEDD